MELPQSPLNILVGPFEIVSFTVQFFGARLNKSVFSSNINNAVGVDVLLELRLHHFSQSLLINFFFSCWNLIALFVYSWRFFLWGIWLDDENLLSRYITERIAIQDITAVLAVILRQPPSYRLTEQLLTDSVRLGQLFLRVDFGLKRQLNEFIVAFFLVDFELL